VPVFFQHQISPTTRLGIWKIEETEEFFLGNVPLHRNVTHPKKRLQHLAGRFLLQFLVPDFPYELIRIADTRKPFLENEAYHFSISHCGDYAAAIVSKDKRVGIDIEIPVDKIENIKDKFLSKAEITEFKLSDLTAHHSSFTTLLWSAKEAVFKWYGNGGVDFKKNIQLQKIHEGNETIDCLFTKTNKPLTVHYRQMEHLVLAWIED
jgi:phosphopantetheinyl transferase